MKRIEDESLDTFFGMHIAMKNLQGLFSYDMLLNSSYCERFMYTLPDPEQKEKNEKVAEKIVSRYTNAEMKYLTTYMVRCATDLAYMPRAWAASLEFNAKYLYNNKTSFEDASSVSLKKKTPK